ncbi:DUF1857-domain-containing protein [Mycena venus]|uniref:DUF1857-domain-containing protein n=1 Tax=Mycena venus TaxID=2733690 RepID=A0A8H6XXW7_9AGAR|nr:DUF1857-domain-containing protein [Mycena venus]
MAQSSAIMFLYALVVTRPVNPPGVQPVITEEQLWKGLEHKARNPMDYLPTMISACNITVDDGYKVGFAKLKFTTFMKFNVNSQIVRDVTEEIEPHPLSIASLVKTGVRVTNIISYGASDGLLLTFTFANGSTPSSAIMSYAFAATRPVNPPGVEPVITEEQLWKALEHKARNPAAFVPMITSCKVTVDEGNKLVREVTFGNSPNVIKEEIEAHPSTIVYFEMNTGTRVTNIVSYGPDDELLLTYGFANGVPGVPADKPKPSAKELNAVVGKTVEGSIVVIRQMVKDGKI